jgi:histidine triad (HIT) family protein
MNTSCFVCQKHNGEIHISGGVIFQDSLIFISHANISENEVSHYLGHIIIEPKRHIIEVSDLSDQEAQAIGLFTSRIARALVDIQRMEHIYTFIIGDGVPHLHIHIVGRYPGAPREYWGIKVDEWPNAPKGNEREITQLSDRIRDYVKKK